jgi:hypothetical protein
LKSATEKPPMECGENEEAFPNSKRCCKKQKFPFGYSYVGLCSSCKIWRSAPDGDNLTVTHIVECAEHGFLKRIRE